MPPEKLAEVLTDTRNGRPEEAVLQRDELSTVYSLLEAIDEREAVVHRSSYEYMKAHGRQFDTIGLSPPWATPQGARVRRGRSGAADELLSAADQQRIDDYWRAELVRLGSDFPYDQAFGKS